MSGYGLGGLFAEYLPAGVDTIMFIVCVFVNIYVNEATFMSIRFFPFMSQSIVFGNAFATP